MGNFLKKSNTTTNRHALGYHSYRSSSSLSRSKILVAFPSLDLANKNDLPTVLKYIVDNFPDEVDKEDHEILLSLYKKAAEENNWNYVPKTEPLWATDDAVFLSLGNLTSRNDRFLLYGLTEELWWIEYEDSIFGSRQFIGQITEINRENKFVVLDSKGNKRRLNLNKIIGAVVYAKDWKAKQGEMGYILFTFENTPENDRKVSWRVLPNDRSETLRDALELTKEEVAKDKKELPRKTRDTPSKIHSSPLPNWKDKLGEKVSVRLLKEDGFKDYYLVVDHLAWDPNTNVAEIGSKGLTITSTPDNLIVSLL